MAKDVVQCGECKRKFNRETRDQCPVCHPLMSWELRKEFPNAIEKHMKETIMASKILTSSYRQSVKEKARTAYGWNNGRHELSSGFL